MKTTLISKWFFYLINRTKYKNRAGATGLGAVKPEEVIGGKSFFDFIQLDYHAIVKLRIQQAFKQRLPLEFIEQKRIRLDETLIDVELSAVAIHYNEKPALMIVIKNTSERNNGITQSLFINDRLT